MGWPKGKPLKKAVVSAVTPSQSEINKANESPEALAKKLDDFVYTQDSALLDLWEAGGTQSPVDVPSDIKTKHHNLRFHWSSKRKWDRYGKNYGGWQEFRTAAFPEGVTRGNDLFLSAMPESLAKKRDERVAYESTKRVKGIVEQQIAQAAAIDPDSIAGSEAGKSRGIAPGVTIGDRPQTRVLLGGKVRVGGGYNRSGMTRSEIHEAIAKEQASRSKKRVYSIPGINPGS